MNKGDLWRGMLRGFRASAKLSQDELATGLSKLGSNLSDRETEALRSIEAEIYIDGGKTYISRLEGGKLPKPFPEARSRHLALIYYFSKFHKGTIDLGKANDWLRLANQREINEEECPVLFGHPLPKNTTSGNNSQPTTTALVKREESVTLLPFKPEAPGEMLMVIAKFSVSANNRDAEIYYEIERGIIEKAQRIGETGVRVEVAPLTLHSRQRAEAEELGLQYNASIVIWGHDSGTRVTVNFLYLRHPDFEAAVATVSETLPNQRTAITEPEAYTQFITHDLPGRLTFLSLFAIAHRYYINKNYPHAITLIKEALASLSDKTKLKGLAEAYYRLGWLYHTQLDNNEGSADYNEVIEIYNRVIGLKPDFARSYNNRGLAYCELGMYKEALADYDTAIQLDPNFALAYNNRGVTYREQGMFKEALADYDTAIQLDHDLVLAHENRERVYRELKIFKEDMFEKGFYIEKPELIKVGVIVFWSSPKVEDIREIAIKVALLNTIPDSIEFTSSDEHGDFVKLKAVVFSGSGFRQVDPDDLSDHIMKPAEYAHRKSEIGGNLLSPNEVILAKKRNGICVFLVIGTNSNGEKCFTYFSLRVEKINHLIRMIQESRITCPTMGRVVHYGLDIPSQEDMDDMLNNWIFTAHKTTVKYIASDLPPKN